MEAHEQIQSYLEQPRRYFNVDGLGEISIGVMLLGYTLIGWVQVSSSKNSLWNGKYGVLALLVYVALMSLGIDRGTKFLKSRITYPRTGFVEYRCGAETHMKTAFFAGVCGAVFLLFALRGRVNVAALAGLMIVPSYAYRIASTAHWKRIIVALLAAGSLIIAAIPPDWITSFAPASTTSPKFLREMMGTWLLESTFIGLTLLTSGAITLFDYLRHTHASDQASE